MRLRSDRRLTRLLQISKAVRHDKSSSNIDLVREHQDLALQLCFFLEAVDCLT